MFPPSRVWTSVFLAGLLKRPARTPPYDDADTFGCIQNTAIQAAGRGSGGFNFAGMAEMFL